MRSWLTALMLGLLLGLGACGQTSKPAFQSTDVTGAPIGGDFSLTGHDGKRHRLADFKGKVVVLFFGYTHCPDVCPTTLSELNAALQQLGDKAAKVQVLFVSVDPERDTVALLSRYVPAFNPAFLGLTGSVAQVNAVAEQFKIVHQKSPPGTGGAYTVDHSAGTYVLDPSGKLRLFVSYGAGSQVFAHDIGLLLE